jgi:cysteine dioxygenase
MALEKDSLMFYTLTDLLNALDQGNDQKDFHQAMGMVRFGTEEVKDFLHFSDTFYTRNLIKQGTSYELMVLCWDQGQGTPIHDHAGAEGWVMVLDGQVAETIYQWPKEGERRLQSLAHGTARAGEFSHVNDHIGVHSITNVSAGKSVTLHLYSPIITTCHSICPDSCEKKLRVMSYHTVNGKVVG